MAKTTKRKQVTLGDIKRSIPKGGLLSPTLRGGFGKIPTKKTLYGR